MGAPRCMVPMGWDAGVMGMQILFRLASPELRAAQKCVI